MTREEARASIKKHLDLMYPYNTPKDVLKVAYEALQQPQVVRCKDCRYWQDNNGGYPHPDCPWGKEETPDPDDYCSFGEPKDGDGDG